MEPKQPELSVVQIDALVVLKIIKHCKESMPMPVTGQLCGLDVDRTLEVTNCFPFPQPNPDEQEENPDADGAEYALEMMRCLREVNVDHNAVGWYQTSYLGSYPMDIVIETQANHQDALKKAIVLLYDPLKTAAGNLYLKAYRLTDSFMELYRTQRFTLDSVAKSDVSSNNIFEEIPVKIRNWSLMKAMLLELEPEMNCDALHLSVTSTPFLERSLEFANECMDDLAQEQNKFQFYLRQVQRQITQQQAFLTKRRSENAARRAAGEEPLPEEDIVNNPVFKAPPEPSRLETMLITHQINNVCSQMHELSSAALSKYFLAQSVHKESSL